MTPEERKAIRERSKVTLDVLLGIFCDRDSWSISIPPQPTDPDVMAAIVCDGDIPALLNALAAAEAKAERYRKALEPFDRLMDVISGGWDNDTMLELRVSLPMEAGMFNVGDLRRVREALKDE